MMGCPNGDLVVMFRGHYLGACPKKVCPICPVILAFRVRER